MKLKRAVVSVSDKLGVIELARALRASSQRRKRFVIYSTGGTMRVLEDGKVEVSDIGAIRRQSLRVFAKSILADAAVTSPSGSVLPNAQATMTGDRMDRRLAQVCGEILGGRIESLWGEVHAGIMADYSNPEHRVSLEMLGIAPVSLVVCNLYDILVEINRPGSTPESICELIDVDGLTLLEDAAKNGLDVLTDPREYSYYLEWRAEGMPAEDEVKAVMWAKAHNAISHHTGVAAAWRGNLLVPTRMTPMTLGLPKQMAAGFDVLASSNPFSHGNIGPKRHEAPSTVATVG